MNVIGMHSHHPTQHYTLRQ